MKVSATNVRQSKHSIFTTYLIDLNLTVIHQFFQLEWINVPICITYNQKYGFILHASELWSVLFNELYNLPLG